VDYGVVFMKMAGTILIVPGVHYNIKKIYQTGALSRGFRWIYCGKDVPSCIELERLLLTESRIKIGDLLQECAKEFRQDYIDYIGDLSLRSVKEGILDRWWLSSLSEKNPFISDVFLYFCYIKICKRIAGATGTDLLIVCENLSLAKAIFTNLSDCNGLTVRITPISFMVKITDINSYCKFLFRKVWFLFSYSSRRLYACVFSFIMKNARNEKPGRTEICIHALTDKRALSNPARYQHIYFRHLGQELETAKKPFFYLIDLLPTAPVLSSLSQLRKFSHQCYLLEEFITMPEIIKTIFSFGQGSDIHSPYLRLADIRMDSVIEGEINRDRISSRREEALLRYFAGIRLSMKHTLGTFVYTFENHIWEKMFCKAFRCKSPDTVLVGYAHSIINPMYTCYSLSDKERELIPLPDIIAVNGKRAKEVLVHSGFPDHMITILGALRYSHLERKSFIAGSRRKIIVLAALSASINDSLELSHKALEALGGKEDITLIIKCHPTVPFSVLVKYFGKLPENVYVREESIEVLLAESHVVLYSESAVCVEALAKGVPLVNIRSDFRIDMNILEGIDAIPSVSDAEEIMEAVSQVLSSESIKNLQKAQSVVGEIFAPLRDDFSEVLAGKDLIHNPR
jgi:glycosyltransferase involved in cell wall biosynthesis